MFYQAQHSMNSDIPEWEDGFDFSFPAHLHSNFELVTLTEGCMDITVDGQCFTLTPGRACLIFPNQIHIFHTPAHSRHILCIFSPKYVETFAKLTADRVPVSNLFAPDPFYLDRFTTMAGQLDDVRLKGLLYSVCGDFHRDATYTERRADRDELLFRIFRFVETHYSGDCTLAALSDALSRHYVYLSKYFKRCTGLSFTEYVNRYRVGEACSLLKNSEYTVLQAALDSGFDSLRSFNRNFKSTIGVTPGEYRRRLDQQDQSVTLEEHT